MIRFLLNDKLVETDMPPGMVMVDFIRYHKNLMGTKIGCREGDCGACTILVGSIKDDQVKYGSFTSCLMPLANARGKHVVTVEGINSKELNFVQQSMCDESATQCGFCTPGFVISLAGFCLDNTGVNKKTGTTSLTKKAIASIDGNICRCTGYKSIERAAERIAILVDGNEDEDAISFLTKHSVLPAYFSEVAERLRVLDPSPKIITKKHNGVSLNNAAFIGGGTDLYVQQPEELLHRHDNFVYDDVALKGVSKQGDYCVIGASVTVADVLESALMNEYFPGLPRFMKLVSSSPIRNMATVAGNFINASPIGDLSIFFLALNAQLVLSDGDSSRELALHDLYQGYKTLAKKTTEHISQVRFVLPGKHSYFNFEKVSKRTHLDIASVNTALLVSVEDSIITEARLSAGGVGPIPFFLKETSAFMRGRELSIDTIRQTIQEALSEITPISDVRGTATYKRLLLKQLIKAHFITMFPYLEKEELIFA